MDDCLNRTTNTQRAQHTPRCMVGRSGMYRWFSSPGAYIRGHICGCECGVACIMVCMCVHLPCNRKKRCIVCTTSSTQIKKKTKSHK